jgi:hypothetical protein
MSIQLLLYRVHLLGVLDATVAVLTSTNQYLGVLDTTVAVLTSNNQYLGVLIVIALADFDPLI